MQYFTICINLLFLYFSIVNYSSSYYNRASFLTRSKLIIVDEEESLVTIIEEM